jgi:hypothetical protein
MREGGAAHQLLGLGAPLFPTTWCATMQKAEQRLVTQTQFLELTNLQPLDIFILIEDGKLPTVKKNGAHLIDLNNARAKCWLPENRGKDLF